MQSITVVGLTTTQLLIDNQSYTQYIITTLSRGRHQEYIFTPNPNGTFEFRANYTPYPAFDVKCTHPTEIRWEQNVLLMANQQTTIKLYDTNTKEFTSPEGFFAHENVYLPPRTVLVISGYSDFLLPLLHSGLTIAFTDTWDHIPSIIPEDVIVIQNKQVPLGDLALRMPPNTRLLLINPSMTQV